MPGASLVAEAPEQGEPTHYKVQQRRLPTSQQTESDRSVSQEELKGRVHYIEGKNMLIDKVIITDRD